LSGLRRGVGIEQCGEPRKVRRDFFEQVDPFAADRELIHAKAGEVAAWVGDIGDMNSRRRISAPKPRASSVSAQTGTLIGLKPGMKTIAAVHIQCLLWVTCRHYRAAALLSALPHRLVPEPASQGMNTENTNGESTPPAITSFSPARSAASSPRK
jgi:hypothetical protein